MAARSTTYLSWRRRDDQLGLAVGDRTVRVPPLLTAYLLGRRDPRLTLHPDGDLLADEDDLSRHVDHRAARAAAALTQAHECRQVTLGIGFGIRKSIADAHHAARRDERDAWVTYHRRMFRYLTLAAALEDLRHWLIDLEVPDGLLASASIRWQRAPTWLAALDSPPARYSQRRRRPRVPATPPHEPGSSR